MLVYLLRRRRLPRLDRPAGSITSHRGDGPPDSFFVSSYLLWILIFVALTVADMPHTPYTQLQWFIAAAGIPVTLTSYHQWPIIFVALWFLPTECWNVLMHIMYGNSSAWYSQARRESSAFDVIRGRSRGRSRGRRARSRSTGDRADGGDRAHPWDGRRRSREESREQHGRWGRRAASVASSVSEYDPRNDGPDWEAEASRLERELGEARAAIISAAEVHFVSDVKLAKTRKALHSIA
eukprot:gene10253-21864_t